MNVNEATREDLLALDGVGDRLAGDIAAARPFERLDDLLAVPGIGEQRLASLRRQGITVASAESGDVTEAPADIPESGVVDEPGAQNDDDDELPSLDDLGVSQDLEEALSGLPLTLQRQAGDVSQPPWTQTAQTGPPASLFEDSPAQQTAPNRRTAPSQGWFDADEQRGEVEDEIATEVDREPVPDEAGRRATEVDDDRDDDGREGRGDDGDEDRGDGGNDTGMGARPSDGVGVEPSRGLAGVFAPGARRYVGQTLLLSAAFYLVLFALYVLTDPPALTEEHVLIALVPFLILLISSGKLREIRGPGGLMLTLQNEAQSDVLPEFTEDLEMGEQRPMEKGGAIDPEFEAIRDATRRSRPGQLTLQYDQQEESFEG